MMVFLLGFAMTKQILVEEAELKNVFRRLFTFAFDGSFRARDFPGAFISVRSCY
jgi:hypothetical protein